MARLIRSRVAFEHVSAVWMVRGMVEVVLYGIY